MIGGTGKNWISLQLSKRNLVNGDHWNKLYLNTIMNCSNTQKIYRRKGQQRFASLLQKKNPIRTTQTDPVAFHAHHGLWEKMHFDYFSQIKSHLTDREVALCLFSFTFRKKTWKNSLFYEKQTINFSFHNKITSKAPLFWYGMQITVNARIRVPFK